MPKMPPLHPDEDFDSPEDAAAFRRSLCPDCEGFGSVYPDDDDEADPVPCATCHGTGTKTAP